MDTTTQEKTTHSIDELLSEAGDYIETRTELWKLRAADKASDIISSTASGIIIAIAAIFFFTLLNIGVALWIGTRMGESYQGFFIVAAFYAVVALIVYLCRKSWLRKPISDRIIKSIFK